MLLALLWLCTPAYGQPSRLELTLVPPRTEDLSPITEGRSIQFVILYTNSGDTAADLSSYEKLNIQLSTNNESRQVTAIALSSLSGTRVPPSGFSRQIYEATLPEQLSGSITMSIQDTGSNNILFIVNKPCPVTAQEPAGAKFQKPSVHALKDLQHPFLSNFSTYDPIYFLFGAQPGIDKTKFQLSFKYRLFTLKEDRFLKTHLPWIEKLNFAYTQTSFWNLKSSSAPFEDSRYMPEIFYYNDNIDLDLHPRISLGIQSGYQHESNGRGGEVSRSTNHAYVKPIFVYSMGGDLYLKFAPRAWIYVNNEDENNPDLSHYRGYVDLEVKLGSARGLVLETHLRPADQGTTVQMDLSYPMKRLLQFEALADFYIHAQYFSGYAEKLLDYQERDQVFRLGFSLIR